MVVKMIKWRPWPPMPTKKFEVNLKVHSLEGLSNLLIRESVMQKQNQKSLQSSTEPKQLLVTVKLKGPRTPFGSLFKRSTLHSANTTVKDAHNNFFLDWEEEFEHFCILTAPKDNQLQPSDLYFTINQVGAKSKLMAIGAANLNLANFVSNVNDKLYKIKIPVIASNGNECEAALIVSLNVFELRTNENAVFELPILPCIGSPLPRILNSPSMVDTDGEEFSSRSDHISDSSRNSFDSDASDEWDEDEVSKCEKYCIHSYGPLPGVNLVVEGTLSHCDQNKHVEDHMPSNCKSSFLGAIVKESEPVSPHYYSNREQGSKQSPVRSILSWRKRKINFMSPRRKDEPLLKKTYGENGGDDIDFDRRLSDSSPSMSPISSSLSKNACRYLDFGDEDFAVGNWERKDLVSRDGKMKCLADVFFATIDQRSEKAAGESACTVLVAVISDWLHQNPGRKPIKTELDTLIREGSAEWRKMCNNESLRERFPDKHFDLDTVLQAKIRPIVEQQEKSFVGFFNPKDIGGSWTFLQGAMSFGNIWDEITRAEGDEELKESIYIVSWNDHFFILVVQKEACYIIDTLGERLYEGCKQAYILRFNSETQLTHIVESKGEDKENTINHSTSVYRGKDACKEFIEGFFAALSLREVESNIKKGIGASAPLLQRLQIEFHFTSSLRTITQEY